MTRLKRRKKSNEALVASVEADLERLRNQLSFQVTDKYIELLYPELCTAADYVPQDAIVILCEPCLLYTSRCV